MTASSQQRINIYETDPESYKPLYALEKYVHAGTLGEDLIALIKIRVSQINHCAYCLDMHVKEARKENVPARKIDILAAWHEAKNFYTEREQAALLLAEEVTLISENGVQDETWNSVKQNSRSKK